MASAIDEQNGQTFPGEQQRRSGPAHAPHHDGAAALTRDVVVLAACPSLTD
jgi:hypothetical protein